MPILRSRRGIVRAGGWRPQTAWSPGPRTTDGGAIQLTATGSSLLAIGITTTQEPITVLRLRGVLTMWLSTITSANDGFDGAFGIGVAQGNAFAAGVASLQVPIDDEGDELWLYHRYFSVRGATTTAQSAGGIAAQVIEVDSRARRRIASDDVLYAAVQVIEVGTAALNLSFRSRMLAQQSARR